jgi:molybdopterin-biosynthesis enzyme MoeA-like protein
MSWSDTVLIVLAILAVVGWWLWVAASRLDRLHRKVGASRAVVDTQLVRRATVAAELATSSLLDPVSSVLVGEAAWAALAAGGSDAETTPGLPPELWALLAADPRGPVSQSSLAERISERGRIESELSATLREVLSDPTEVAALRAEPGGEEVLDDLGSAWYRVQLSRRFHNEAVAQTRRMRRGVLVRALRLAGHAPEPRTLELDDEWPDALGRPGVRSSDLPTGG